MSNRPTADRPPEGRWLTYAEAAQLFGISSEALRSLARRHHWDRRSPNAVGGQSWVLVPADRLPAAGCADDDRRLKTAEDRQELPEQPAPAAGREDSDPRPDKDTNRPADRRPEEILTGMREMAEIFMGPVREQIADLKIQLNVERKRADRAEDRVRELQEKLEAEMTEQRQVVGLLADKDAMIAAHEATIADLRHRFDIATQQLGEALQQVRLLTDQRQIKSTPPRSWWPWRHRS